MTTRKGLSSFTTNDAVNYQLYSTVVLSLSMNDNTMTLRSGGWHTNHTKNCINDHLPEGYQLYQQQFEWYVRTPTHIVDFDDGMTIDLTKHDVVTV